MNLLKIVDYKSNYAPVFKELNERWIKKYFTIELQDIETLNSPQEIIDHGGFIIVCLYDHIPVGVCAVKKITDIRYELCKFAVDEQYQGMGIGKLILEHCISGAKIRNIPTLFLEGNTKLGSSIHLYEKFGFKKISLAEHAPHYSRVDIIMELNLI
ncbi:GNAT family N-acetyltransferase [Sphingobacterium sp. MYb388]|uniref:GNAT family N-acetyltransferase n=1 Tax=Sphingobacterium sp. MYb388 TaxID=2745437 RepID=UPI00309A237E